jgi:hypothetical protein
MNDEAAPETEKQAKKREAAESASPYSISVGAVYDGPLDLLLDLIRKQDIDIYDIPIGKITAQFLAYVEHLKQTEVDAAADFIYVASLLIHIKSRMLLPRTSAEGVEGEQEDPRRELVERLLEHERFKNAAQMLLQKQQIEAATWPTRRSGNSIRKREPSLKSLRTRLTWCACFGKSSTERGRGRCSTSTRTLSPSPRCSTTSAAA